MTLGRARRKNTDPAGISVRLNDLRHIGDQVSQLLREPVTRFILRAPEEVVPRVGTPRGRLKRFRGRHLLLLDCPLILRLIIAIGVQVRADHTFDEVENGVIVIEDILG